MRRRGKRDKVGEECFDANYSSDDDQSCQGPVYADDVCDDDDDDMDDEITDGDHDHDDSDDSMAEYEDW